MFQLLVIEPVRLVSVTWHDASLQFIKETSEVREDFINHLKVQLEQERKEKKMYMDLLHGYLGLVNIPRRDLPETEKRELKNFKIPGKTFAHKRSYLENEFRKEKTDE